MILKVTRLVSMSGGETDDVVTYATDPNQCTYDFNNNSSFDEIFLIK